MGNNKLRKSINRFIGSNLKLKIQKYQLSPFENPSEFNKSSALRLLYFDDLLNKVKNIEGCIIECGVGWGRSLFILCLLVEQLGLSREILAYDSFDGFPEPSAEDDPGEVNIKKGRYKTSEKVVCKYLLNSGISSDFLGKKVHFHKGYFEDSLQTFDKSPIALLHIDADLYNSYKDCLMILFPYVSKGGIIAFDEYANPEKYPGCKKAVDEFFNEKQAIVRSRFIDRYYIVNN